MGLNFVWNKGYAHVWDKKLICLITFNADQYKTSFIFVSSAEDPIQVGLWFNLGLSSQRQAINSPRLGNICYKI